MVLVVRCRRRGHGLFWGSGGVPLEPFQPGETKNFSNCPAAASGAITRKPSFPAPSDSEIGGYAEAPPEDAEGHARRKWDREWDRDRKNRVSPLKYDGLTLRQGPFPGLFFRPYIFHRF